MATPDGRMFPTFMLMPSSACPAKCRYCFGPHAGPVMSREVLDKTLGFMAKCAENASEDKVRVIFHGGEPLVAGLDFWRAAVDGLRNRLGPRGFKACVQSNLWLLDDPMCEQLVRVRAEIGTSLDGPREITDAQRGAGYFDRTMAGIRRAQQHGLDVECIATFTPHSVPHWRHVFDFFLDEGLNMSVHASVPPLTRPNSPHAVSREQYGELLCEMLDYYLDRCRDLAVSSLDQICQSVGSSRGHVCTFRSCLGMFLAVGPEGNLYPCQRFASSTRHRIGTVADEPDPTAVFAGHRARWMAERQRRAAAACAGCPHVEYCRGGCAYNAVVAGALDGKDPYCHAYRMIFDHILSRLTETMATQQCVEERTSNHRRDSDSTLLPKDPLIELVSAMQPHPSQVAQTAKRIVAAVELARGPDIPTAGRRLVEMGICRSPRLAERSLEALREYLKLGNPGRNNLYLHVTFRCQMACTHCYARADQDSFGPDLTAESEMPPESFAGLIREAKEAGFRQLVITGGEPLIHHRRAEILEVLEDARKWTAPMNLVLRTNLAVPLSDDEFAHIALAVDQAVVSVDGDESSHDARRGRGSHAAVIANLRRYADIAAEMPSASELSLAAVLSNDDIQGRPGQAVRELGQELGVRRVRFRPILPIGRAVDWDQPPVSEALGGHADPMELIVGGFLPTATCGIGQNLYVEPSGESFPCYAFHLPHSHLGNVLESGLVAILDSPAFGDLACHGVDTNAGCRTCEMRYLCGGACRAWGGQASQYDLDTPPSECTGLRNRASRLYQAARDWLASP